MAEGKKIATGYIGNALRSSAADHTTTFTDEVFDTERQKYQSEVNTDIEEKIESETQERTQNDQLLSQAIAAEQERAEAAEQANATEINAAVTKNEEQDQKLSELGGSTQKFAVSNNSVLNNVVKELYIKDVDFSQVSKVFIYKAVPMSGNFIYGVLMRTEDNTIVIDTRTETSSQEKALSFCTNIFVTNAFIAVIDWSKIEVGATLAAYPLVLSSICANKEYSPTISSYLQHQDDIILFNEKLDKTEFNTYVVNEESNLNQIRSSISDVENTTERFAVSNSRELNDIVKELLLSKDVDIEKISKVLLYKAVLMNDSYISGVLVRDKDNNNIIDTRVSTSSHEQALIDCSTPYIKPNISALINWDKIDDGSILSVSDVIISGFVTNDVFAPSIVTYLNKGDIQTIDKKVQEGFDSLYDAHTDSYPIVLTGAEVSGYISDSGKFESGLASYTVTEPFHLNAGDLLHFECTCAASFAVLAETSKNGAISDRYHKVLMLGNSTNKYDYTAPKDMWVEITYLISAGVSVANVTYSNYSKRLSALENPKEKPYWGFALRNILCIGDSLTEGAYFNEDITAGITIEESYPYYLGRMLNTNIVNGGHSGYSPSNWFTQHINDYRYDEFDAVIIWLGTNNAPTTAPTDNPETDTTETGYYQRIIERIKSENSDAFILMLSIFGSKSSMTLAKKYIQQIADKYNIPLLDMSDISQTTYPELHNGINNPHFGKAGNIFIANRIKNYLYSYFSENPLLCEFGWTTKSSSSVLEEGVNCIINKNIDFKKDNLKILDIGNSYTEDMHKYIANIISSAGFDASANMSVYRTHRGGGSFRSWYDCYNDIDTKSYDIVHVAGVEIEGVAASDVAIGNGAPFRNALQSVEWDIIIIHQASEYATNYDAWKTSGYGGCLNELLEIIKQTNPNALIGTYIIHSYMDGYTLNDEGDSEKRWENIAKAIQRMIKDYKIDFVIPYGTAVESIRKTCLNDQYDLTRDGTHLARCLGAYIAGCCLYQTIFAQRFGRSIVANSFRITDSNAEISQGVHNVTDYNSQYVQRAIMSSCKDMFKLCEVL